MKKIFFLSIIALQGLMVQGQAPKDSMKTIGFSIEPVVGIGTSEAVQNGTNNLGWKAGCGIVYMFNANWGISSGLQVQRYSTKVVSGRDSEYQNYNTQGAPGCWADFNIATSYNFTYIELPIIVRYTSSNNNKPGIFTEAGFILCYLISSDESGIVNQTSIDTTKALPFLNNSGYPAGYEISGTHSFNNTNPSANSFNLQWHCGIGLFIPINEKYTIVTNISINKGLTNIGNSSKDILEPPVVPIGSPIYYYNRNNNLTNPIISNYSTNFSGIVSLQLNIKL